MKGYLVQCTQVLHLHKSSAALEEVTGNRRHWPGRPGDWVPGLALPLGSLCNQSFTHSVPQFAQISNEGRGTLISKYPSNSDCLTQLFTFGVTDSLKNLLNNHLSTKLFLQFQEIYGLKFKLILLVQYGLEVRQVWIEP